HEPLILVCGLLGYLCVFYALYRRVTQTSIAQIPAPEPEYFLLCNLRELFQAQAAETDFKWQAQYGHVARFKAPSLPPLVSDPKALQYIYQTSDYNFVKPERREVSRILSGWVILFV
ncbi:hypothetical protein L208DRAFT_1261993, partial [Tricholoma matsutake]